MGILEKKFYNQFGKNIKISAVIGLVAVPIKKTIFTWPFNNKKVFNISQFFSSLEKSSLQKTLFYQPGNTLMALLIIEFLLIRRMVD